MGQKILIVDDEIDLLEILAFNLERSGFEVIKAISGEDALDTVDSTTDLILMDVMMGGMDGFMTTKKMRDQGIQTPIIFLTARDAEGDILEGFGLGADDYIAKPFSVRQVVARVKAVLARIPSKNTILEFANITLDPMNKVATLDGESITLTKTEFLILQTLMMQSGKILSRSELIRKAWGATVYVEERTVDVHIARLRKKLGESGSLIVNRSGYGYELKN